MKPGTAKTKGRQTENLAVQWLQQHGAPKAERRRLTGSHDQGDITGIDHVCIEVKSAAKINIPQWLRELDTEIVNANATTGAVMARPKGQPDPNGWWIIMTPQQWHHLMTRAGYLHP